MTKFELLYLTLQGELLPEYALPGVENAFAPGSECLREYTRMREAYERLCTRLGAGDQDPDLDAMVDALESIQRALCLRIYSLATL